MVYLERDFCFREKKLPVLYLPIWNDACSGRFVEVLDLLFLEYKIYILLESGVLDLYSLLTFTFDEV